MVVYLVINRERHSCLSIFKDIMKSGTTRSTTWWPTEERDSMALCLCSTSVAKPCPNFTVANLRPLSSPSTRSLYPSVILASTCYFSISLCFPSTLRFWPSLFPSGHFKMEETQIVPTDHIHPSFILRSNYYHSSLNIKRNHILSTFIFMC